MSVDSIFLRTGIGGKFWWQAVQSGHGRMNAG
jgi:hypothetical protein